MRVILLMGLTCALISCGQSGDLYLSSAQEKAAENAKKGEGVGRLNAVAQAENKKSLSGSQGVSF
jgi:hypothetical protein